LRETVEDDVFHCGDHFLIDGRPGATPEEVSRWLDSENVTHPLSAPLRVRAACEVKKKEFFVVSF
jgi:hypothetical protein